MRFLSGTQIRFERVKECSACGETKPLEAFHRKAAGRMGRQSRCKACTTEYFRIWYASNGESVRERSLDRVARDPEANRAKSNAWKAANKERHHRQARESKHRRRAIEKKTAAGPIDEEALWIQQEGLCALCATPIDRSLKHPDPFSKSLDHRVPISRGGSHTQDNIQWAHLRCNLSKGASVPDSALG